MPDVLIARAFGPGYDYLPNSLVLEFDAQTRSRIQSVVKLIRAGVLGPVEDLSGVELGRVMVYGHPLDAVDALQLTEAQNVTPYGSSVSGVLLKSENLLEEEQLSEFDLDWEQASVSCGHVKVDEQYLWIIGFVKDDDTTRLASGRIDLAALGIELDPIAQAQEEAA